MSIAPLHRTLGRRACAHLVDLLVFTPLMALDAWIEHAAVSANARALWFGCVAAVYPVYRIYLHGRSGQTLGKWLLRVAVVDLSGAPLTMGQALRREAVNLPFILWTLVAGAELILQGGNPRDAGIYGAFGPPATLMFGLFGLELISTLASSKRRALHDFIADSVVVRLEPSRTRSVQSAASPLQGASD